DYRRALKDFAYDLSPISGKAAGLWGYFLALASKFANKKIVCVIPINLLRGRGSLRLREHFLNGQYTWRYIVKATENYGFTERAEYRDILLVVDKKKASSDDKLGVILLKKRLEKMSLDEAKAIALRILKVPKGKDHREDDFDVFWIDHKFLFRNKRHLMRLVAFSNLDNLLLANSFMDKIIKRGGEKLTRPSENWFIEGFRPVPQGLSQVVFVTRPFHEGREKAAFMTFVKEEDEYIHAQIKEMNEDLIIRKDSALPSLRTLTGVRTFDISNLYDYVLINQYPKASKIIRLSKLKEKSVDWEKIRKECKGRLTRLSIAHRINWYSPNVAHLAFYSDIPYAPSNVLEVVKVEDETDAKIISLSLNSTLLLLQLFMHKEESTGRWLNIRIEDLVPTYVLDTNKLNMQEKESLLTLFNELRNVEFPGYRQQLKERFWGRVKLDTTLLKILGFSCEEIQNILPKIYDMLYYEMMKIRRLTKD
ncbi:MAG: hypothetical protein JTT14_00985, partial [Candidatus Brockarchaeota archaeon]|nr:hypothetical protein [Candidatus Brockarchaeota archaeon]